MAPVSGHKQSIFMAQRMNFTDYVQYDAVGLAELIRAREVTREEVRETALDAITNADPTLGMMTELFEKDPLPKVEDGRFEGVPFVVKDIGVYFEGLLNEFGCRLARGLRMDHTSPTASLLHRSGVSLLGRSTTPELGIGYDTRSILCGQTRNPHDPNRSAGGSSGGSAALVASGCLPMAHGTDSLGSLRIPAHCCGVFGLKPARGHGISAPGWGGFGDLTSNHVLTRSVRDSASMLDALETRDPCGRPGVPVPPEGYLAALRTPVQPLNIRVVEVSSARNADDAVSAALATTLKTLEDLGHTIETYDLELDLDRLAWAFAVVVAANQARAIQNVARVMSRVANEETLEAPALACLEYGSRLSTSELFEALDVCNQTSRRLNALTDEFDVLVSPTCLSVAPPAGANTLEDQFSGPKLGDTVVEVVRTGLDFFHLCPLLNISGQPAASFPVLEEGSMPAGVQLITALERTDLVLQLSRQLEEAQPMPAPRTTLQTTQGAPRQARQQVSR